MSVDLEAGGALATAGLAARELDKGAGSEPKKKKAKGPKRTHCANCDAKLVGAYCHHCGQASHVHRSLWHMLEETLHSVFHFDTKSWRTLPLLVARPGLLTKRYINGQRVRYVSPLALFLFATFLMFFAFSMFKGSDKGIAAAQSAQAETRAELESAVARANKAVAKQSAKLAKTTDASKRQAIEESLSDATTEQQLAQVALTAFDQTTVLTAGNSSTANQQNPSQASPPTNSISIETGNNKVDTAIRKAWGNPELMSYKLKNTAYKFSFMLIPISLPFLWLMFFWRPGITLYDHTIFSLYSLSFMSLFFALLAAISAIPVIKGVAAYLLWFPPLHMFLQLRETYALSFGSTLWRTIALLFVAGTVFILFLIMIATISMS